MRVLGIFSSNSKETVTGVEGEEQLESRVAPNVTFVQFSALLMCGYD